MKLNNINTLKKETESSVKSLSIDLKSQQYKETIISLYEKHREYSNQKIDNDYLALEYLVHLLDNNNQEKIKKIFLKIIDNDMLFENDHRIPYLKIESLLKIVDGFDELSVQEKEFIYFGVRLCFNFPGPVGSAVNMYKFNKRFFENVELQSTCKYIVDAQNTCSSDGFNSKYLISQMKGGLSVDLGVGCPMGCLYCYRVEGDNGTKYREKWLPQNSITEDEAITRLINHPWFTPHVTPIGIHMSTTEAFLPQIFPSTLKLLQLIDNLKLTNRVSIITKATLSDEQLSEIEKLRYLDLDICVCYSGMKTIIEPTSNLKRIDFLRRLQKCKNIKSVGYFRPIIEGYNTDDETIRKVFSDFKTSGVKTIVFGGLKFSDDHKKSFMCEAAPLPNNKFLVGKKYLSPETVKKLNDIFFEVFSDESKRPQFFRRSSCARIAARGNYISDYNTHYTDAEKNCQFNCKHKSLCLKKNVPSKETVEDLLQRIGKEESQYILTKDLLIIFEELSVFEKSFFTQNLYFPTVDLKSYLYYSTKINNINGYLRHVNIYEIMNDILISKELKEEYILQIINQLNEKWSKQVFLEIIQQNNLNTNLFLKLLIKMAVILKQIDFNMILKEEEFTSKSKQLGYEWSIQNHNIYKILNLIFNKNKKDELRLETFSEDFKAVISNLPHTSILIINEEILNHNMPENLLSNMRNILYEGEQTRNSKLIISAINSLKLEQMKQKLKGYLILEYGNDIGNRYDIINEVSNIFSIIEFSTVEVIKLEKELEESIQKKEIMKFLNKQKFKKNLVYSKWLWKFQQRISDEIAGRLESLWSNHISIIVKKKLSYSDVKYGEEQVFLIALYYFIKYNMKFETKNPLIEWGVEETGIDMSLFISEKLISYKNIAITDSFSEEEIIQFLKGYIKNTESDFKYSNMIFHGLVYSLKLAKSKKIVDSISSKLSIGFVIPMWNEKETINSCKRSENGQDAINKKLDQLDRLLLDNPFLEYYVTFIDDNDPNHSGIYAKKVLDKRKMKERSAAKLLFLSECLNDLDSLIAKSVRENISNNKKGGSVQYGLEDLLKNEKIDIVCYTDLDLTIPLGEIGILINEIISKNYSMVIGSRKTNDAYGYYKNCKPNKTARLYSALVSDFLDVDILDFNVGCKMFLARDLKIVLPFVKEHNLNFDVELIQLYLLRKLEISEKGLCFLHQYIEGKEGFSRNYGEMLENIKHMGKRLGLSKNYKVLEKFNWRSEFDDFIIESRFENIEGIKNKNR